LPNTTGRVVEVGHRDTKQRLADGALDRAKVLGLVRRRERECLTGQFRARSPANAMHVVLRTRRDIEIHHMAQRLHVNAASGNVSGDQHAEPA